MQQAVAHKPHADRLVQVEVIDSEDLDAVLHGEQLAIIDRAFEEGLVKPLPPNYVLPTDNFNEPSRTEFFLEGRMEGQGKSREPAAPAQSAPQPPAARPQGTPGGFEMK